MMKSYLNVKVENVEAIEMINYWLRVNNLTLNVGKIKNLKINLTHL